MKEIYESIICQLSEFKQNSTFNGQEWYTTIESDNKVILLPTVKFQKLEIIEIYRYDNTDGPYLQNMTLIDYFMSTRFEDFDIAILGPMNPIAWLAFLKWYHTGAPLMEDILTRLHNGKAQIVMNLQ